MKTLLLIGLFVPWMATAQSYFQPRVGGGYNYYGNLGQWEGYTTPRVGGGYNYYGNLGQWQGYTTPRVGGGYNLYPNAWGQ